VLTSGSSLNEFEFPPHSGINVVSDVDGPISMDFSSNPVLDFAAYFTYMLPVTIEAYDAGNNLVDSVTSAFFANMALSGDNESSPNELLQVSFASGISSLVITGNPIFGGSFVMDDASYTAPVPEPSTISLLLVGGIALFLGRKKLIR
jgi:hypothetical protein